MKHTTVFGHFSRPKEALHRYAEKICKFSMKEIQQRTKVMLEFQQLKKDCFARPSFEYGDLGLYNPWWILTLWRREWKSVWLQFQSQSAAIILRNLSPWNAKRRPMILCLGLWLWWGFQMIRSHCKACQLFWDCNKQSVCNTQHARLNVSWSGRRVGLMDFDKLRESDCKRFWLFTHLQFVSTVAVLIPVASLFHLL